MANTKDMATTKNYMANTKDMATTKNYMANTKDMATTKNYGKIFAAAYDIQAQQIALEAGNLLPTGIGFVPGGSCDTLANICRFKHRGDDNAIENCVEVNSTLNYNQITTAAASINSLKELCSGPSPRRGCFEKPHLPTCKLTKVGVHLKS